jgi:type II secretory pathway component GspD/PulD (secretin)
LPLKERAHFGWRFIMSASFSSRPGWFLSILVAGFGLLTLPAVAAEPDFVGILALTIEDEVAKKLGLSEKQRDDLLKLIDDREAKAIDTALKLKELPAAERTAQLAPFRQESETQGLALLTAAQRAVLEQIRIQKAGMITLTEEKVADELELTDEQKKQISELMATRAVEITRGDDRARAATHSFYERKLFGLLEGGQRARWEELAGGVSVAADLAQAGNASEQGASPAPAGNQPPATSEPPMPAPGGAQPPAPRPTTGSRDPRSTRPATGNRDDIRLKFAFRYQPWADVLDWFAEQADLSLIMDAPPQGTFNYTNDRRTYTPAEAIDILNSVLLTKGYTLVIRDRMLFLINLEDPVPPNLVPYVPLEDLDKKGEFELVSVLFNVQRMTPEEVATEVERLKGPQGAVIVLPKAGLVQVTETAGRLRMIRRVIESIENPEGANAGALRAFDLKHASLNDLMTTIRPLLDIPADQFKAADNSIMLAIDPNTGKLLATGRPEKLARVEELVKMLDIDPYMEDAGTRPVIESPQLEVHPVASADSTSVLAVLQTLLANNPDVRLTVDPKTGHLVALARPSQHATIRETIRQMESDSRRTEVMRLTRLDPTAAAALIDKLYPIDVVGAANAPKVIADPGTRNLIVRASESQLSQIRQLLAEVGESGMAADGQVAETDSNILVLPYTGRNSRIALEQLQQLWPTMRQNKIRVVSPSTVVPNLQQPGTDTQPDPLQQLRNRLQVNPPAANPPPQQPKPQAEPAAEDARARVDRSAGIAPRSGIRENSARSTVVNHAEISRIPLRFVSQNQSTPSDRANEAKAPAATKEAASQPSRPNDPPQRRGDQPASPSNAKAAKEEQAPSGDPSGQPAPIIVAPTPGGLMIASNDKEALREFETLLRSLYELSAAGGQQYTVYYLQNASATTIKETLDEIFGTMPISSGGGGGLLGDLAGSMLGGGTGGIVGTLLGMGSDGGSSVTPAIAGAPQIVAETRLNALIVMAKPADLDTIEQLLQVLDTPEVPDTQVAPKPRFIQLNYISADAAAEIVREVFAERLAGSRGQQRQPSPEEFIQMLRGGRDGGGRGGNSRRSSTDQQKMTIGVDTRNNILIVAAPQSLFDEVRTMVEGLDTAANQTASTAVRVVTLRRSNASTVQKALSAITNGGVQTQNKVSETQSGSGQASSSSSSSSGRSSGSSDSDDERRRRFFDMMQQFRGGDGGSRGPSSFGGSSSGGSRGFSPGGSSGFSPGGSSGSRGFSPGGSSGFRGSDGDRSRGDSRGR